MKALRNARSRLITEEVKNKIIMLAKQLGKVKNVETPKVTPPSVPPVYPAATEAEEERKFNEAADLSLVEQDPNYCLCGVELSEKALKYYTLNPTKERICYNCNQSRKAGLPYGKNRTVLTQREAGQEG